MEALALLHPATQVAAILSLAALAFAVLYYLVAPVVLIILGRL